MIDFRWRIFLRVSDAGSLSKAAAALAMLQSMVSRAVSHLERQCGERLFVRTGRGVVRTAFAGQILPRVTRLVADADLLIDDIRNAHGQPMGDVMVGLLPSAVSRYAGSLASGVRGCASGSHPPGVTSINDIARSVCDLKRSRVNPGAQAWKPVCLQRRADAMLPAATSATDAV